MIDALLMVPLPKLLKQSPKMPDLGLGYLASMLKNKGFSVKILDWNTPFGLKQFEAYLSENKPRIVGIKVFTVNLAGALKTIEVIRRTLPEAWIIVGGPHPSTSEPEDIFIEFKQIDFAFKGEAETSFTDLSELIQGIEFEKERIDEIQSRFETLPGLVWQDHGCTFHAHPVMEEIGSLPLPAWDLIDPAGYVSSRLISGQGEEKGFLAPILTTRGCPFPCRFCCAWQINGKKVRRRSVGDVVDEIALLYQDYHVRQFIIVDNSFMLDSAYVHQFCTEIISRDLRIGWDCIYEILVQQPEDEMQALLEIMGKAGCNVITLGLETADPAIMKVSKKQFNPDRVGAITEAAHRAGIRVNAFFMLGFPDETLEQMNHTIRFGLSQPFDAMQFSLLLPLPGTEIYQSLKQKVGFERLPWATCSTGNPGLRISKVHPFIVKLMVFQANLRAGWKLRKGYRKIVNPAIFRELKTLFQ